LKIFFRDEVYVFSVYELYGSRVFRECICIHTSVRLEE